MGSWSRIIRTRVVGMVLLTGALCSAISARAIAALGGADGGSSALATDAGSDASADEDPRTANVHALIDGSLALEVEPQSLFDVTLTDEAMIRVEAARLGKLLQAVDHPATPTARGPHKAEPTATPAASAADAGVAQLDPGLWRARAQLDRARLAFYTLPLERRTQLLADHAARREAARPQETDQERRAREAEEERKKALVAAHEARSEAQRLVAEELARLLDLERSVALVRQQFADARSDLSARRDSLLGWQHRIHEAEAGGASDADAMYDAVRKTLRASRDDLAQALTDADYARSQVPNLGPDPLQGIPPDVSTDQARKRRALVAKLSDDARADERALRNERAATLLNEIDALNRDRLELLAYLSGAKRGAITGFSSAGFDQAHSEARQLFLILRYHRHIAAGWLADMRDRRALTGVSWWRVTALLVPSLLLVLAFVWWRRRSVKLLALAEERLAEADRRERRAKPSPTHNGVRLLRGFHRALEWLLFLALAVWILPANIQDLLEVQLLTVIVGWTLGGALVVNLINAVATLSDTPKAHAQSDGARLRLRSLRLVGRVVVVFALVLVLSARLVGNGTVYSWVWSTCWFAAVPLFLILVRWWRETVFQRVERVRRKSALQAWVLANRSGWKSFFAAMIAAVQMFSLGAYKTVRAWVAEFDLARRAHAYLFKRELLRLAGEKSLQEYRPLSAGVVASLSPDRAGESLVPCPADDLCAALRARIASDRGGLVAIVGARGLGKSTLLRQVAALVAGSATLTCTPDSTVDAVQHFFGANAKSLAEADSALPRLLLIDDAHALIKPILGGLRSFDETLAFARAHSDRTLWLFALDRALWPFLQRARDSRPLFDEAHQLEPWDDEQIGQLLAQRCGEAGVEPTFEDLLEKLPPGTDEIDKQEALTAKRIGYHRVVWDYALGNPGLALEVWRTSLGEDSSGAVRVRPLSAPNAGALELLPDSALFILRAILQMGPASIADVARATRIAEGQVQNAVRFGHARGYLSEDAGRVRVTWPWLRSVTALLERRHLLVNS